MGLTTICTFLEFPINQNELIKRFERHTTEFKVQSSKLYLDKIRGIEAYCKKMTIK